LPPHPEETARSPSEPRKSIRERLGRRLSAPRRIGVPYRMTLFSVAPGFDAVGWVPGDVLGRFFAGAG
jgi:hypothetical protein